MVERHPIVKLQHTKHKHRESYNFIRSYPSGVESFIRIYSNELLKLNVNIDGKTNPELILQLYINLSISKDGEWNSIPFKKKSDTEFSLETIIKKPGSYMFKLKYSTDDGKHWFEDRIEYTYIIVDPKFTRNLKLYSLIPTCIGHIGKWKEMLFYIKDLGFNAVHLLPISKMGYSNSPYAAENLFEIDPRYAIPGDPRPVIDQFEQEFVETAKEIGIKLCFDLVLNHVCSKSEIVLKKPEWIKKDQKQADGLKRAGCWDFNNWVVWGDLVLLYYDNPHKKNKKKLWEYMTQYTLFWANYANYTNGIVRLDNLHSSNMDFAKTVMARLQKDLPHVTVFAELFSDFDQIKKLIFNYNINILLATPWGIKATGDLRGYIEYLHTIGDQIRYLTPLNTHDSGSPTQEYGSHFATASQSYVRVV